MQQQLAVVLLAVQAALDSNREIEIHTFNELVQLAMPHSTTAHNVMSYI